MNRNSLKILAAVFMLLDHVGLFFFDGFWPLRLLGRLAFPIFAFFIAEGLRHTHSRKKYVLTLLLFAVISQVPYAFLHKIHNFNILFTFLLAIFCIFLVENYKKHEIINLISLLLIGSFLICAEPFAVIDYGIFGVLLVMVFYFFGGKNDRKSKAMFFIFSASVLYLMGIKDYIFSGFEPYGLLQLFSLVSLCFIALYNGEKGKHNLKWFFYIFYPLHLTIILVITLLL